jgi:hypothetical protein
VPVAGRLSQLEQPDAAPDPVDPEQRATARKPVQRQFIEQFQFIQQLQFIQQFQLVGQLQFI